MNIDMEYVYILVTRRPITDSFGVAVIFEGLGLCFNVFVYKPSRNAIIMKVGEFKKLLRFLKEVTNAEYKMRDFGYNSALIYFLREI
ncbi:hypothetical protein HFC64_02250 [Saccharolobus solfataricus]|uniref:Uncharacterized protein n=1 Tax=Saccharolobus solfataricus TaxID=2287 RepID=A0A157T1G8_SACSO|nr:hypothetical protein [Saccharolobus solfataricus]QPG48922.1 hypothetical protein HFC64_02250 [Saccharolobus solfataricus]SAI85099.1 uncharacterised protein [Saccharolobus solfataricus]